MRFQIAAPGQRIAAGDLAEAVEVLAKALEIGIDDRIRPIGRDHASRSSRIARIVS